MNIISIESYKSNWFTVKLDNGKSFLISAETLQKHGLQIGGTLDENETDELLREELLYRAMRRANYIIAVKSYSTYEINQKLKKRLRRRNCRKSNAGVKITRSD